MKQETKEAAKNYAKAEMSLTKHVLDDMKEKYTFEKDKKTDVIRFYTDRVDRTGSDAVVYYQIASNKWYGCMGERFTVIEIVTKFLMKKKGGRKE